jgi:hypothetical protein
MGAGVEPSIAAAKPLDGELAGTEINIVEIGDLELTARRRLERPGDFHDARSYSHRRTL